MTDKKKDVKEKKEVKVSESKIEKELFIKQTLDLVKALSIKAKQKKIKTELYLQRLIPVFSELHKLDLAFLIKNNGYNIINTIIKFQLTMKFIDLIKSDNMDKRTK